MGAPSTATRGRIPKLLVKKASVASSRSAGRSVLFAALSFPITSARMEAIESRGGNAFAEYQVPLAILTLLQGLGRLIRHRQDRGVLALLDPRVRTRGYGARFLASLPPAPVVHDLEQVAEFLGPSDPPSPSGGQPVR